MTRAPICVWDLGKMQFVLVLLFGLLGLTKDPAHEYLASDDLHLGPIVWGLLRERLIILGDLGCREDQMFAVYLVCPELHRRISSLFIK